MARIVLAMSGGVDSSVAAHLLMDAGHEVIGVFMRHGEESAAVCRVDDTGKSTSLPVLAGAATSAGDGLRADHKQGCCTASDAADARRVAAKMGIPFYALDLTDDFRRIVDYFVDDYLDGRTPNPCVRCNQWIKFGRLFDYADDVDAEFVATGHYAQMQNVDGVNQLHRGLDSSKDQSYALFGIRPDRLDRMMLPVGGFEKTRIREIAEGLKMGVAGKKDSQEICFVTQGHHSDFVRARAPQRSADTGGEIVTVDGKVVGTHQGYEAFTVGQRKKLGVAMGEPYFVVRIEPKTRQVVIGKKEHLSKPGLVADEANWLVPIDQLPQRVSVQIRYNGSPKPGTLTVVPRDPNRFEVHFDEPELAVAPGQAAVVYDETRVLGGGWIT
ncbi:tRNA-specific 2-thiouridylase MnmA [Rubripirellula lacrimiformis]|uniref:tRNA-specific 2-thiouridylase MnmA n=1 Tax=Rubripirellula lacrimiformis TaxID=1930273 RepID=A0A517N458_9BACT|nr:tRNA 2-thiouridine(34) synthase MnmA [Rubripirellula lacrimiformis]QDT01914.1 tRNA-specific 2-thiouridylase MnmA [Rubripirellula lacrimiformis]